MQVRFVTEAYCTCFRPPKKRTKFDHDIFRVIVRNVVTGAVYGDRSDGLGWPEHDHIRLTLARLPPTWFFALGRTRENPSVERRDEQAQEEHNRAINAADVRRFDHVINKDGVLGTHRMTCRKSGCDSFQGQTPKKKL